MEWGSEILPNLGGIIHYHILLRCGKIARGKENYFTLPRDSNKIYVLIYQHITTRKICGHALGIG